jgi:hypothetical protein
MVSCNFSASRKGMAKGTAQRDIARLHEGHPRIRAEDWRSPLVARLIGSNDYRDGSESVLSDFLDEAADRREFGLVLSWEGLSDDFTRCLATYQEIRITEFAALGLCCVLLSEATNHEITEVTRRGEKADYWLGDKEMLVEVSGQTSGDLDALREEKQQQLLENPHNRSGFVCVCNFQSRRAYLWFYSPDEEV